MGAGQNTGRYAEIATPGDEGFAGLHGAFSPEVLGVLDQFRNRQTPLRLYVGYLIARTWRAGAIRLEPLFCFDAELREVDGHSMVLVSAEPTIHSDLVSQYDQLDRAESMAATMALSKQAGLDNGSISIVEMNQWVRESRPGWPWVREDGPALSNVTCDGIHDRAMLFLAEPSNITKGLEIELTGLRSKSRKDLRGTALGELVYGDMAPAQTLENWQLLEPLPLNPEQRHAIRLALTRSLTVVSGPPGTGKSQLVASLILNASKRGQRVLFSSKNHKAVKVVQDRVNELAKLPAVLRLGDTAQNAALLQNLTSLQTNGAGRDSQRKLEVEETGYAGCSSDFDGMEREMDEIVRLRNEVDKLEQGVVRLRESLGAEWFQRLRHVDGAVLERGIHRLRRAIRRAKPTSLPKWARCLWWAFRGPRDRALVSTFGETKKMAAGFGMHAEMGDMDTPDKLLAALDQRLLDMGRIQGYSQLLNQLLACRRVEDVTGGLQQNRKAAHEQATNLWKLWMECAPNRVAGPLKQHLANFINNLQTMVNAGQQQRGVPPAIHEAFQENLQQVLAVLPAWAVTSLAAHKRIPLQAGMFDLVVIDEASQCDIAAILPLLYRSKKAVIIGDSRQLRHISGISPPLDGILRNRFGLACDAAWSFPLASAFDLAASRQSACRVDLKEHHRSHPDIIGVANELFYEGSLRVATRVDRLMVTNGKYPAVQWMEIDGSMEKTRDGWENHDEAKKVVRALDQLLHSGYEGSIGIITPFRGQKNCIDRLIVAHPRAEEMRARDLLVDTVHKFQGDERDLIIFSPVLSQNSPNGPVWFLRRHPELVNVAITRARAKLLVVGDCKAAAQVDYLKRLHEMSRGLPPAVQQRPEPEIPKNAIYPAVSKPETVSGWEKILFSGLWHAGVRSMPQYPVDRYAVDLVVIVGERRLAIEVDGESYHREWDGERVWADQLRDARLRELGWDVMRFWVYEIRDEFDAVIARVRRWVELVGQTTTRS